MATKTAPDVRAVVEALKAHDTFCVSTHISPEGDALGSAIALALGLRAAGKQAEVVIRTACRRTSIFAGAGVVAHPRRRAATTFWPSSIAAT
jgi:nanoRNase/pAp phosphatase (c-di-AMP/oligoRNAs hydrolase)